MSRPVFIFMEYQGVKRYCASPISKSCKAAENHDDLKKEIWNQGLMTSAVYLCAHHLVQTALSSLVKNKTPAF